MKVLNKRVKAYFLLLTLRVLIARASQKSSYFDKMCDDKGEMLELVPHASKGGMHGHCMLYACVHMQVGGTRPLQLRQHVFNQLLVSQVLAFLKILLVLAQSRIQKNNP